MRTPHGDADVSIVSSAPAATLGDVVAAITGQAVPRLAMVNGRLVDATTPLSDVGLSLGAVVTTEPTLPDARSEAEAALVQVAGHGAGRVMPLGPGRYRIGPGRRSSADELDLAPVEDPAFELVISPTTSAAEVTVIPTRSDVALDGTALPAATSWHRGTLTAGPRAFELDVPADPMPDRSLPRPDADGTVAFSRPPRREQAGQRRPVADALRQANGAERTLWERRPDHPDAYALPFGVRVVGPDTSTTAIDLRANRAVAIAGTERFRTGLARTLVVEAVTLHGPADLDVVVLTAADRLAAWEWVKWLPHARLDGPPAIFVNQPDIRRWTELTGSGAMRPRWTSTHLTMVVLDDPGLWNRRDSPLRAILSNPPEDLRFLALCDDSRHAPAVCTALISEATDGLARLQSFTGAGAVEEIHAALTEPEVALLAARSLAPLADVDLPTRSPLGGTSTGDEGDASTGVLDDVQATDILARWEAGPATGTVTIGHRDGVPVRIDADAAVTVVLGPTMRDAFDVAASIVVAQCTERAPDDLWVVPLTSSERAELLWRLPHAADRHDDVAIEPERLLGRLRALVSDGPERIVLVCEADHAISADRSLVSALADGVEGTDGLALVVVTDRSDLDVPVAGPVITVERHDDPRGRGSRRLARMTGADVEAEDLFFPVQPAERSGGSLELRPYVVGRALSTLERRLDHRRSQLEDVPNPTLVAAVDALREAADRRDHARSGPGDRLAVPPPMPTSVALATLFETSPGDGVPLGVQDDPQTGGVSVRWWQPGSGSLLLFGSRRSGVAQVLSTITLGVLDRFPSDEVRLVAIESSATRRRALVDLDRSTSVVDPEDPGDLADALDLIADEIGTIATERPRPVVLVADLVDVRHQHAGRSLGARIDEVLVAAAGSPRVDVIAYAGELDGAGPFATAATARLVGASSKQDDLAALGVDHPETLDGIVGRCRSFPGGDLVQLAMSDTTFEQLIARRSTGGAR